MPISIYIQIFRLIYLNFNFTEEKSVYLFCTDSTINVLFYKCRQTFTPEKQVLVLLRMMALKMCNHICSVERLLFYASSHHLCFTNIANSNFVICLTDLEMPPHSWHVVSLSFWRSSYVHGRRARTWNTPPYRFGSSAEIFISADTDNGHFKLLSADTDVVPILSCIPNRYRYNFSR